MSMSSIVDGNEAVARVAYQLSEVIAIYPITPSSSMSEWADQWSAQAKKNLWGTVPLIQEMQSEAGAVGAVHGALQTGTLATTFTSSQGLLLMIPTMYKIAGELTPTVFHVAARSVAAHALSIFGDHSDVMSVRMTGFALLASGSVQEAQDLALIAHAATLQSRVPFLHFFDGFRTSHEVASITSLTDDQIRALINDGALEQHRARALRPEAPVIRGTAQNPDVFFQNREAGNRYHNAVPGVVQNAMEAFAAATGRVYRLFDYHGAPDAERVIVMMGSGAETAHETVDELGARGQRVGVLKVRLYRPFSVADFVSALPPTVRSIAVLDRTKEPGAAGEPLYLDVVNALAESGVAGIRVIGGRYGLSSKEFSPAMAKAVYDELDRPAPKRHFVVGINDDVTHVSLAVDPSFRTSRPGMKSGVFYGLGADGTVSANKSSIHIIGDATGQYVQAYFSYDSKKSGSVTVSHLRFGPQPIRSAYLVDGADFVGCHQFTFLDRIDVLARAASGATFLLNSPYPAHRVWDQLSRHVQTQIIDKHLKFYVVDAYGIASRYGLRSRINTIMQTCFFALTDVLPVEQAVSAVKAAAVKAYARKGLEILKKNVAVIDDALKHLARVEVPAEATSVRTSTELSLAAAPAFVRNVLGEIIAGRGDQLPVSAFPADGTYPVGTAKYEKRNVAPEIPVWEEKACIQCGKCVMVCPHAAIRAKVYDPALVASAPATFKSISPINRAHAGKLYTIQVAPEDCTGCSLCVEICPAKSKREPDRRSLQMKPVQPLKEEEKKNWDHFLTLPSLERGAVDVSEVRSLQFIEPMFEFSGACTGCGETPYVRLMSQLFGDRSIIANATGCSSIYGGNLPTTPWTTDQSGRGPAWSNSLFENNAEFALGFRLSLDKQAEFAAELLATLGGPLGPELVHRVLHNAQANEADIAEQRALIEDIRRKLADDPRPEARRFLSVADTLVRKCVWALGGDGWAYDIGFGGLDHVLASGKDVNVLVLDTEVYSNTGGQTSKSTPRSASAKFSAAGKSTAKKDLGLIAMSYGNVYVASVALGARDEHTVRAFLEAERYRGPSLIIAYSHCIAHGIDMNAGLRQQKLAVQSGYWPLYRFDPERRARGLNPLQLDSARPAIGIDEFMKNENRFDGVGGVPAEHIAALHRAAAADARERRRLYEYLAARSFRGDDPRPQPPPSDPDVIFSD